MSQVALETLIALLATWLGATVVARTPRDRVARAFGLMMALAATWSLTRIVWRLTGDDTVRQTMAHAEVVLAELAPATVLSFVLAYLQRRPRGAQLVLLTLATVAGLAVGLAAIIAPDRPISPTDPERLFGGTAGAVVAWGWIAFRALVLALAFWWTWRAWRRAARDEVRHRQLLLVLVAIGLGAASIFTLILAHQFAPLAPFGTFGLAGSIGLATYAVFGGAVFIAPTAARRSFWLSLGTGTLTAFYILALLGLDRLARRLLVTEAPIVTTIALALTIALFDPVRDQVRRLLDRLAGRRELPYRRLLRAFGDELLTAQRPDEAIGPALGSLCRAIGARGATIYDVADARLTSYGQTGGAEEAIILPLSSGNQLHGRVVFGPKQPPLPYTRRERDLLDHAAGFIAAALQLAARQQAQALTLESLAAERNAFQERERALATALAELATNQTTPAEKEQAGLQVYALGPLRVERDGVALRQWGGAKAGSRQAEAIFAFLFDRGERGVAKDEFLELIWPDVLIDKADLAFHRTLGGLRRTLEPQIKRASDATAITFHNDRYRLDPALIAWNDLAAFEERTAAASVTADPDASL
ncbi:MAG TPA: histidine kinase N-terminal 7TM domain-containing protein, partial [Thermomicrobiales bacterium]